jgi:predicted nucleotidyltransferase
MKREEALKILGDNAEALRRNFGVAHLDIFGSVARDEAGPQSDIDILVEYQEQAKPSLFDFVGLQQHLETARRLG